MTLVTAGIAGLRKIQIGREATAGTEVDATVIWRGTGSPQDDTEVQFAQEYVGYIGGVDDRSYIPKYGVTFDLDEVEMTFEQCLHVFEASLLAVSDGAADGAGSSKIYTYPLPTSGQPVIKTYTMEFTDNIQEEQFTHAYVEAFTISGTQGEALKIASTWKGRQLATGTVTGALSVAAVEEILMGKGKLYIDAASDTIGTTQKTATLLSFSLDWTTGWKPVSDTGDGSLFFPGIKCSNPEGTLTITFEHDATSVSQKAAWRAEAPQAIQLKFEGSAVATPGTTYTYKTLIINLVGKWVSFAKVDEQDGNDIVEGTFKIGMYDTAQTSAGSIVVVNELTAVP